MVSANSNPTNKVPVQNTAAPQAVPVPASSSPWDEDLPLEAAPGEKIVGTLSPEKGQNGTPAKADSFVVPKNIEATAGPQIVTPQSFPGAIANAAPRQPQPVQPVAPIANLQPSPQNRAVPAPAATSISETSPAVPKMVFADFGRHLKLIGSIATILILFSTLTWLTEIGMLSLGLEKVYGFIGLERLWGGLPAKTDQALGRSLSEMRNHPDFKVSGSLEVTIDKSKKSPVVAPLVSLNNPRPEVITKALLAVVDEVSWEESDWPDEILQEEGVLDSSLDEPVSSPAAISDPSASSVTTPSTTTTAPVQTDTETYQPYQNIGSSVKDLFVSVDGFFGQVGNAVNLEVKKVIGTDQIALKNQNNNLWVRSPGLKFDESAKPDKWLEYRLESLSEKDAMAVILEAADNGLTIQGKRTGNEKVGRSRTYRYQVDEISLGSSLDSFGLRSDSVQSIEGDVWIDIKTKLVRKIELKITMSPSYSVTKLTVKMELSDYDTVNAFSIPGLSEIIDPNAETGETVSPPAAGGVTPTPVDVASANDATRKSDLSSIKTALELYRGYYYSYPKSTALLKLNTAGNSLEKLLAPGYIASLPKDPKDADGWFYGYKSADGKTYQLSARLESQSDPAAVKEGEMYLYFLKNQ